jgi:hypothetical protein
VKLKTVLQRLVSVVVEEAERNSEFAQRIESALGLGTLPTASTEKTDRAGNRRKPATLDPVELARQSEEALRQSLAPLNLEQLKDIIADYGMDPGKLAMKWKTPKRIIDRIVEVSLGRAAKGDVFLHGRPR